MVNVMTGGVGGWSVGNIIMESIKLPGKYKTAWYILTQGFIIAISIELATQYSILGI